MENLDSLTRKLLTAVREIKIDLIVNNKDRAKEDIETAISLADEIYAELYTLKLRIEKQEVLR
jgi:thiamine pyrophosphokinase